MRLIVLDTGTLGMVSNPRGRPRAVACRQWARALPGASPRVRVLVPEIADYEIRRELLHRGATAGLRRLDQVGAALDYLPITTAVMRRAAELCAAVRRGGLPTAVPETLDGDCALAAQAPIAAGPGDAVVVATDNVGHLGRFPGLGARPCEQIAP